MILEGKNTDVLNYEHKLDNGGTLQLNHIAFAVNTEGINDSGFAGMISSKYWKELATIGEQELGTVLTKEADGKTFHALVCHSLKDGWQNQEEVIKECFDKIESNGEPIASIAIGTGLVGQMSGADFGLITSGMMKSKAVIAVCAEGVPTTKRLDVYAGMNLDECIDDLVERGKRGEDAILEFNDNVLSSRNATVDGLYTQVTGLPKAEHEAEVKKYWDDRQKESEKAQAKTVGKLPDWVERGKKVVYPQMAEEWQKEVEFIKTIEDANSANYQSSIVHSTLEIMEALHKGATPEELEKLVDSHGHSGYSHSCMVNRVARYAPKGLDYFIENSEAYKYDDGNAKKFAEDIKERNAKYDAELGLAPETPQAEISENLAFARQAVGITGDEQGLDKVKKEKSVKAMVEAMDKYGDNKWWLSNDLKTIGYHQMLEPTLLVDFSKFHEGLEELVGRPVFTHEMGLNADGLRQEAAIAWETGKGATPEEAAARVAKSFDDLVNAKGAENVIGVVVPKPSGNGGAR